jgi:hypothetical protein
MVFNYSAPHRFVRRARVQRSTVSALLEAAEAIRYAVEKLPAEALPTTSIEVDDERYDAKQIRALYENENYPLARK